jgi:hypothetical protein
MIKKYSLIRKRKSLKQRSKRRSRKRCFGKSDIDELTSKDYLFNFISKIFSKKKIIELLSYSKSLFNQTLNNIKPNEFLKLTWWQKIQKYFVNLYKPRIDRLLNKLTPLQIIMLLEGKYTLGPSLIFSKELPEIDNTPVLGIKENTQLLFLKSIFGKTMLRSIKTFIESLSSEQLVLLINNKYDLKNAIYNAFINTKYPTQKETEKSIKEIKNDLKSEV